MVLLVVYVNAVQGDVGLVRFATIDGSGAMIGARRAVGPQAGGQLAQEGNAGLEREQADDVAPLKRQLGDSFSTDGVAQRGIGSVHLHGLRRDRDHFGNGTALSQSKE